MALVSSAKSMRGARIYSPAPNTITRHGGALRTTWRRGGLLVGEAGALDMEEAREAYRYAPNALGGPCTCRASRRASNCERKIPADQLARGGDVLATTDPISNRAEESKLPDFGIRNLLDANRRRVNSREKNRHRRRAASER